MNHGMNTHNLNMHNNLRKAHFNQSFRSVLQRLLAKGGDFSYLDLVQIELLSQANIMMGHISTVIAYESTDMNDIICSEFYKNENQNIY